MCIDFKIIEETTTTEKPNSVAETETEDQEVTDELLKKECPDALAAFDKLFCANFVKQNIAKRDKIKGEIRRKGLLKGYTVTCYTVIPASAAGPPALTCDN